MSQRHLTESFNPGVGERVGREKMGGELAISSYVAGETLMVTVAAVRIVWLLTSTFYNHNNGRRARNAVMTLSTRAAGFRATYGWRFTWRGWSIPLIKPLAT